MNIKTVLLATLVSAFPVAVQAQDLDNYQVGCDSGAECNDFKANYGQQADAGNEVSQRTRTRRTRSTNDSKYYVGATIGVFFPSEIDNLEVPAIVNDVGSIQAVDPGTGFGGSLYGGYKFSEYISADVEGFVFFGDADPLDSSYTSYGFFVNPRFTYTFDDTGNSLEGVYVFASPGIGLAGIDFGEDIGDALGDNDSGTGFALQIKAGAGYPVSDKIDIIGQARYLYAFSAFEVDRTVGQVTETEDQDFDAFSIELGVNYKI